MSTTQKISAAPKSPAGSYMENAEAVLMKKAGVILVNTDVRQWLEQQQTAGVPVSEIAEKWKAPENGALAREMKDVARLIYVSEELERLVERLKEQRGEFAEKLQSAGIETVVDLAEEHTEALVETTARLKTFTRFRQALESRMAADELPAEIYATMSAHVYSELAKTASGLRGRTTSWKAIAYTNAVVAALGDTASLFLDVAKI